MAPALTLETYVVTAEALTFPHDDFSIMTVPIEHTLCGDLTLTPKFDSVVIDNDDRPVSYEEVQVGSYTVFTEDHAYFNQTIPYQLAAELTLYPQDLNPTADTKEATNMIHFDYPCTNLLLFKFEATEQATIPEDMYTGVEQEWELTPFLIEPAFCTPTVTYDITSVTGPDGNDYK